MGNPPGPLCAARLGPDWIDNGTACLSRTPASGPIGDPKDEAAFDAAHVYSTAAEARRKRRFDLDLVGDNFKRGGEIRLDNEAYLKRLIEAASGGRYKVGAAKAMQFFIVRGGGEGFIPYGDLAGRDSSDYVATGVNTRGKTTEIHWDLNDLLIVFDSTGALVSAAPLLRPMSITGMLRRKTSSRVYNAWHNKQVFVYRNTNFDIPYLGLAVRDRFRGKGVTIDMHKQENTNGCIFIYDRNTPKLSDPKLKTFEPRLILDVLRAAHIDATKVTARAIDLGWMRMVDI